MSFRLAEERPAYALFRFIMQPRLPRHFGEAARSDAQIESCSRLCMEQAWLDRPLFTVIVWTSLGSMPGHPLVYKEFFTREACEQAGKQLTTYARDEIAVDFLLSFQKRRGA